MRIACLSSIALGAALAVLAPPEDYGPFAEGEDVRAFPVRRCMVVAREAAASGGKLSALTYVRGDGKRSHARLRLTPSLSPSGVLAEVLTPDGAVVIGPRLISDRAHPGRAWWADLNGDGREDFIAEVRNRRKGPAGYVRDVAFVLSSPRRVPLPVEPGATRGPAAATPHRGATPPRGATPQRGGNGYRVTTVRTLASRAVRFVDLGDGKCRFVHTAFVDGRSEKGADGKPHNYWVHSLLEFEGDRVVLSRAHPRFPMWVWHTFRPNHRATSIIAPEQKRRLWARVPERIFWRPSGGSDRASPSPAAPVAPTAGKAGDAGVTGAVSPGRDRPVGATRDRAHDGTTWEVAASEE